MGRFLKANGQETPRHLQNYDKNSDGFIASDEKPTGMPTLELMDKNGDGKVTKDEFPADAPADMFNQFDKDKNGSLNESEVASPPSGGGGAAPGSTAPAQK